MARFLLLDGLHMCPDFSQKDREGGHPVVTYHRGATIDTDENLLAYNSPGMPPKYQLLDQRGYPTGQMTGEASTSPWTRSSHETHEQYLARLRSAQEEINRALSEPTPSLSAVHVGAMPGDSHPTGPSAHSVSSPSTSAAPVSKDLKDYFAGLEKMSVKELQQHAQEEEVDLRGSTNKAEILRLIRQATLAPAPQPGHPK